MTFEKQRRFAKCVFWWQCERLIKQIKNRGAIISFRQQILLEMHPNKMCILYRNIGNSFLHFSNGNGLLKHCKHFRSVKKSYWCQQWDMQQQGPGRSVGDLSAHGESREKRILHSFCSQWSLTPPSAGPAWHNWIPVLVVHMIIVDWDAFFCSLAAIFCPFLISMISTGRAPIIWWFELILNKDGSELMKWHLMQESVFRSHLGGRRFVPRGGGGEFWTIFPQKITLNPARPRCNCIESASAGDHTNVNPPAKKSPAFVNPPPQKIRLWRAGCTAISVVFQKKILMFWCSNNSPVNADITPKIM